MPKQRQARLKCKSLSSESEEKQDARLQRICIFVARIATEMQILRQVNVGIASFNYHPNYDYQLHRNVFIRKNNLICQHCQAKTTFLKEHTSM